MSRDWRLDNLEGLRGVVLVRKPYRMRSATWDHDHCTGCFIKIAEAGQPTDETTLHWGYATTAAYTLGEDYEWVCDECFDQVGAEAGLIDATPRSVN